MSLAIAVAVSIAASFSNRAPTPPISAPASTRSAGIVEKSSSRAWLATVARSRRFASTPASIALHVRRAAQRHRLPESLVSAVIAVESNGDVRAISRRGALGLMQLMPATAALLGVRDAFDPADNIDAGARHLRDLLDRFGNDLSLTLAAYNAGPDAVLRHGGVPPYPETRAFVARVMSRLGEQATTAAVVRTRTPATRPVRLAARLSSEGLREEPVVIPAVEIEIEDAIPVSLALPEPTAPQRAEPPEIPAPPERPAARERPTLAPPAAVLVEAP